MTDPPRKKTPLPEQARTGKGNENFPWREKGLETTVSFLPGQSIIRQVAPVETDPGGVDRGGDRRAGSVRPLIGGKSTSPPLVSFPYGHNPLKQGLPGPPKNELIPAVEPSSLRIYPDGFRWNPEKLPFPAGSVTGELRGEIKGFSKKAAARLRAFAVEHWGGEGTEPYAFTLTSRKAFTPEQWRGVIKRFRTYLQRKYPAWAALWRVELQKRAAPHLHCIFWIPGNLPANLVFRALRKLWLAATGEEEDRDSRRYAVKGGPIEGGRESGWLVYTALHSGKHKTEQLGWQGKQWGLWNRDAWQLRPPIASGEMTEREMVWFLRVIRRWARSRHPAARRNRFWCNSGGMCRVVSSRVTVRALEFLASGIPDASALTSELQNVTKESYGQSEPESSRWDEPSAIPSNPPGTRIESTGFS